MRVNEVEMAKIVKEHIDETVNASLKKIMSNLYKQHVQQDFIYNFIESKIYQENQLKQRDNQLLI